MNKNPKTNRVFRGALFLGFLFVSFSAFAFELKIASLAPEGSTWMQILRESDQEIRKVTGGQVTLAIYPGGAMGDEQDVIRKMRTGQLHAAGVTGRGLGMILPEIRVMELPFLYRNYEEVEKVRITLADRFEAGLKKKGFVLLGWAENGFVYIFSKKPIANEADLKKDKMWIWVGDPLVAKMYEVFDITPVPLTVPDVLTSLQTGLVGAAYAPPLAAAAMQWFTATSYVTDLPLAHATGAIIVSEGSWNKLTDAQKTAVQKVFREKSAKLNNLIHTENEKALNVLLGAGMKKVKVSGPEAVAIRTRCFKVWEALTGQLYSKDLLGEVQKVLQL